MTMLEIYKTRKDRLIQRVAAAKSLYETTSLISEMMDTMKYQYLAQPDCSDMTDKLEELIGLVKSMLPLIETVSKSKLWEKADGPEPRKKSLAPGFIALLLGIIAVIGPIEYYIFKNAIKMDARMMYLAIIAGGIALVFLAGFLLFFRKKPKSKAVVEIDVDERELADRLEEIMKAVDVALDSERADIEKTKQLMETAVNDDELRLFSYLMEAKMTGSPEYALEQLDEVEHYLLSQDILVINYSKGNEKYFDFVNGEETKTVRPAFVREGRVLMKGIAQIRPRDLIGGK